MCIELEEDIMKKLGYVVAALGALAIVAPTMANAETVVIKNGYHHGYGARAEICQAARRLAEEAAAGRLDPARIDETLFARFLYTWDMPDPDLVIRTSGEQRISNFLLWQVAYAELVFLDTFWPDFSRPDFERAIAEFSRRDRRYGSVSA